MHKDIEEHRAWVLAYRDRRQELERIRRAILLQPDEVVVERMADGHYVGESLLSEKRLAANLCFVRGYSNLETACRLRVCERTVQRYRVRWRASLDQVGD